ncbi:MAG TPA: hypothetical protein VFB22_16585 [Candidatus Baltobacteraceae bacterium]|nr:hypothetical protein [Candidatus Baltobacteraceae bacterium]
MTEQQLKRTPRLGAASHDAVRNGLGRSASASRTAVMRMTALVVAVALLTFLLENVLVGALLPNLPRLTSDFSATYLRREMRRLAAAPPRTLFFGDSVLWGYRIAPSQTAVAVLRAEGCACENLSLKSGSPPNYDAMIRIALGSGVRPREAVIEINQKAFNAADPGFVKLHPALAQLGVPYFTAAERRELGLEPGTDAYPPAWTRALDRLSLVYAMRTDIRGALYGDVDAAPPTPITADMLEGTYDLSPLSEANAGIRYLSRAVDALRAHGIPVVAFLTPTNHRLLHDYIDVPAYRANGAYLRRLLERHGARVLDLDARFAAGEFIDEAHLTPAGQRHLARLLEPLVLGPWKRDAR